MVIKKNRGNVEEKDVKYFRKIVDKLSRIIHEKEKK